jgi:hypothetical protein
LYGIIDLTHNHHCQAVGGRLPALHLGGGGAGQLLHPSMPRLPYTTLLQALYSFTLASPTLGDYLRTVKIVYEGVEREIRKLHSSSFRIIDNDLKLWY